MIPIYLSVLMGGTLGQGEEITPRARVRLMVNGLSFILGFTAVFVLLGLTATALGRFMLENRLLFQQLGGLLVFVFGLKFLGWLRIDALEREKRIHLDGGGGRRLGAVGAFTMGLTFAFGWTPCIGPVLGAILTFTAVSADGIWDGAWNLFVYAAGIGVPLLLVAVLAQRGVGLLNRIKRFIPKIEKTTGVILVAMGVLMVTDNTTLLTFGVGEDASAELSIDLAHDAATPAAAAASPQIAQAASAPGEPGQAVACDGSAEACDIAPPSPFEVAMSEASPALAAHVGEARALYFHQPNCPNCLKLAPIIAAMTQTCSGQGLRVEKIDVSQGPNKALAAKRGVRGTPTLVFEDADGTEVARFVGGVDLTQVHEALAVLTGERCADFTPFN
jgi:cytochrome c-type biogenesis protein